MKGMGRGLLFGVILGFGLLNVMAADAQETRVLKAKNASGKGQKARARGQNWRETAREELIVRDSERSSTMLPTPATVRTDVMPVLSPLSYTAMQMGLSVQPHRARGRGQVTGLDSFDLGATGENPLPALDLRWLPLEWESVPNIYLGGFVSVGYNRANLNLETPTGERLKNSELHTFKGAAGIAGEWHWRRDTRWSVATLFGAGRMQFVQSSASAFANRSVHMPFGSAGVYGQFRFMEKLTAYLGYDHRVPLREETADMELQRHNVLVGILGSFR